MPEREAAGSAGAGRPGARPVSLRLRMTVAAGLMLAVALSLVGLALAEAQKRGAETALAARMESYVYLVLAAAEVDDIGSLQVPGDIGDPRLKLPGSGVYVHIHGESGHWSSPSAIGLRLPELQAVPGGQFRFAAPEFAGDMYTLQFGVAWQLASGEVVPYTLNVLVDPLELEREVGAFRLGLWRALGTAGLILLLAQAFLMFLAFRPLQRVARDVGRVESGAAPSLPGDYPAELEPLARNVNRLLSTEKANQQRYRNALDSLAHSLKTPLAVIRAGVEQRGADSTASLRRAVDDMHHLITTRLQRAAASTRRTLAGPVPVAPEAARLGASLSKVHSRDPAQLQLNIPGAALFYGEQRDLVEMLGNLMDNAFKYGSGRVWLSAGPLDGALSRPGLWITVEDDGPGIEPADWPALLQRGVRGDERVEGHGLGLPIVLELVTAYGGTVELGRSDLGGASIRIELPGS